MKGAPRLLALLCVVGLALAALVLPVAAQTQAPPAISIFSIFPRCLDGGTEGNLSGAVNRSHVRLEVFAPNRAIVFTGFSTASGGGYTSSFGFVASQSGEYEFRVTPGFVNANGAFTPAVPQTSASAFLQSPCRAPVLEFDPPCSGSTTTQVRVTGRWFEPFSNGYVDFDNDGTLDAGRLPVDNRGSFTTVLTIKPSGSPRTVRGYDLSDNSALGTWSPCPPGTVPTTTTSTTTSTTAPPDDTVPDETTTTRPSVPGSTTTTPVTVPPTVDIPPPTPGAGLTVSPRLGPPGFVTGATGTGFPPGPVTLTWAPGIGSTTTIAGPDGTFSTRVLVFDGDRLGPRALIATGVGGVTAYDAFLVVPSTVQPSGQNVAQITRIRRFIQR